MRKFDPKQIFPDTAPQPKHQAHIKEQTDGRKSKTIVRIQSSEAKRRIFPGIPVRHRSAFDTPGLEENCLRQNRLYKPHCIRKGDASAQRAAPGRAGKISVALQIWQVLPKFSILSIFGPCRFCAHQPTLVPTNLISNKYCFDG